MKDLMEKTTEEEGSLADEIHLIDLTRSHTHTIKYVQLECGPIPKVMPALPNIGGALCEVP